MTQLAESKTVLGETTARVGEWEKKEAEAQKSGKKPALPVQAACCSSSACCRERRSKR
jgi:hypothetical protein